MTKLVFPFSFGKGDLDDLEFASFNSLSPLDIAEQVQFPLPTVFS